MFTIYLLMRFSWVHIEFFLQQLLLPGMNCNIFHLQSESLTCHDAYTGSVKIIPEELT